MNIEVREDSVRITGYVNAVERLSKPITEKLHGKLTTFLERIKAGVFRNALKKNDNVLVLLNHNKNRVLANTKDSTAKLTEDNIGLRADVTIYDKEVVEKARNNKLVGWSFGFYPKSDEISSDGTNNIRTLTDLYLSEVSILDDTKEPAYYGTSIEARALDNICYRSTLFEENNEEDDKENTEEETQKTDAENQNPVAEEENPKKEEEKSEDDFDDAKLDMIAEKIAIKIVEKMTGAGAEKTIPETPAEEEGNRAIDYSSYEKRIEKIKKSKQCV